jgi:hypothetical protein
MFAYAGAGTGVSREARGAAVPTYLATRLHPDTVVASWSAKADNVIRRHMRSVIVASFATWLVLLGPSDALTTALASAEARTGR